MKIMSKLTLFLSILLIFAIVIGSVSAESVDGDSVTSHDDLKSIAVDDDVDDEKLTLNENDSYIDDENYNDYFEADGTLKEGIGGKELKFGNFTGKNFIINQESTVISGVEGNVLNNCTVYVGSGNLAGVSNVTIQNLKFVNNNLRNAIVLNNAVSDSKILNNDITMTFDNNFSGFDYSGEGIISWYGGSNNIIANNLISISGDNGEYGDYKLDYLYGIDIVSGDSTFAHYANPTSYVISNNTININTENAACEGIYLDAPLGSEDNPFIVSNNAINVSSTSTSNASIDVYGISSSQWNCDRTKYVSVEDNQINAYGNNMVYGIDFFNGDDLDILNNYVYTNSNGGAFAIATTGVNGITIKGNNLNSKGKNSAVTTFDSIGAGIAAIYIPNTNSASIEDNVIYVNSTSNGSGISVPSAVDGILIKGNDINVECNKDSYAIIANKVTNLTINENTINFTGNTDGSSTQYAVSLSNINYLVFDSNNIDARLPSLPIKYDLETYFQICADLSLYIVDSNNSVIKNNKFNVVDTVKGTGYETLYNIYLKGDSNLVFDSNEVITSASRYAYGIKAEGYYTFNGAGDMIYINSTNITINNNNIKSTSDSDYAAGIEFGSLIDATVYNNEIQADAVSVAYDIYAAGYNGPTNLVIDSNQISSSANSVYGIELYGCKDVTISANNFDLEGNYTMGIATSSVLTTVISNEISAKGEGKGTPTGGDAFASDNIGIFANSYADTLFVSGNNIYSSAYGIISNCKKANIINNKIEVNGNNSIGVQTNAYTNIMGNNITSKGVEQYCELGLPNTTIVGILATSDAIIIAHNNVINTNGNYSIDLTDSCKNSFVKNIISNNYLVANNFVGNKSVTFKEGYASNSIIANNTPIVAVITASNIVKYYRNGTKLIALLKDADGNVIVGKSVTITIGKSTYTATTNKNGYIYLALNQAKGSYIATIKFSDAKYVTVTKKVSIKVVAPTMKAVKNKVKKGKYFQVTFKDANNKVIKNQKVTFKVKGKTYTATTNSKGIAKLKLNIKKATYKIVVGFKNVNPYGKTTKTIKVKVY